MAPGTEKTWGQVPPPPTPVFISVALLLVWGRQMGYDGADLSFLCSQAGDAFRGRGLLLSSLFLDIRVYRKGRQVLSVLHSAT